MLRKRLRLPELPAGTYFPRVQGGLFGTRYRVSSIMLGDADQDLDLDLHDVAAFQGCFGAAGTSCQSSDLNLDGGVDLADAAILTQSLTGPN